MKNDSRIWIAVIFIAVGFIFLIDQLGFLAPLGLTADWFLGILWPLIIIVIGFIILFRNQEDETSKNKIEKSTAGNVQAEAAGDIDEIVIFSGKNKRIDSKNFKEGKATSIFGGMKIDLRDIRLSANGATMDVASVFGSIKIYVPKNIRIESSGTPIMGSWENKFKSESKVKNKVLKIIGVAIFGSVEIIN